MKTAQFETNNNDHDDKQDGFFRSANEFLGSIWQDIKKQIRTIKFWIELGAVAGGLFYAGNTYLMWRDSHNNFMIDERAWIVCRDENIPLAVGQPITQHVFVENTGKTPARNIHGVFRIEAVNSEDIPSFDYSRAHIPEVRDSILYPKNGLDLGGVSMLEDVPGTNVPRESVLSQELFDKYNKGEITFVIYAKLGYWDSFKIHHSVTWCDDRFRRTSIGKAPLAVRKCDEYKGDDDT